MLQCGMVNKSRMESSSRGEIVLRLNEVILEGRGDSFGLTAQTGSAAERIIKAALNKVCPATNRRAVPACGSR